MNRVIHFGLMLGLLLSLAAHSAAQENQDTEAADASNGDSGCTDLASFRRLGTSTISSCHSEASMDITVPLQPDAQGYARQKKLHGAYEFREYHIPPELQDLAYDNLLQLLPMSGFIVKYSASPSTITGRNGDDWILINVNGDFYDVTLVNMKPEPWTPVKDAAGITQEMNKHGHVALYGIEFSHDENTVVEENSVILGEALKYLQANPNMTVTVESHKDSANGSEQSDLDATTKRARAVAAWFVAHGVPSGQVQSKGLGRTEPITENDTPLEVQQNERIELVKHPS